jgi:hypothetical protein
MDNALIINGIDYTGIEKRECVRLEKRLNARVKDALCAVLNISNKGILLETDMPVFWFPLSEDLQFELEIDGEWASLSGTVKWIVSDALHSRIGIFIRRAPDVYLAYLKKLYSF